MKKILVLAALAALVSSSAYALSITGTAHDLSSGGNQAISSSNVDEICVFCHTPHGANMAATAFGAPLWNRAIGSNALTAYNSGTLTNSARAANLAGSDAVLCLSCHDGASMAGPLTNPLNSGAATGINEIAAGDNALIGVNLSNDHPVGFNFALAVTQDSTGLKTPTTAGVTFGGGNDMWCSSCHDVHDNANKPFLVMNNAGSNLCLDCHKK